MPFSLNCKACKAHLNVPDKFAGKKIKCPKCSKVVSVPGVVEDDEEPVEIMPDERIMQAPPKKTKPVPRRRDDEADEDEDDRDDHRSHVRQERDDERSHRRSRIRAEDDDDRRRKPSRSRHDDDLEDEEDDRDEGPKYKPCPQCRGRRADRVKWTAWGSFYGPAMFTHVRCRKCGYAYNGRTGRSNILAAIVFVTVPLAGIAAIIGAIFYIARVRGHI